MIKIAGDYGGSGPQCPDRAIRVRSPDVGPHGGRAQRVEIRNVPAGQRLGLFQPVYLPLHRTQKIQFRILARSMAAANLQIGIAALDASGRIGAMLARQEVALGKSWAASNGILSLPAGSYSKADAVFAFTVSASSSAHFLIDSLLLYPDDHVNFADPDVVRFYRDARLPLMRWPGGNFVSGYHWRDGVGPFDRRPTRPNPTWGALEYNLFGTDEFIALCSASETPSKGSSGHGNAFAASSPQHLRQENGFCGSGHAMTWILPRCEISNAAKTARFLPIMVPIRRIAQVTPRIYFILQLPFPVSGKSQ